MAVASVPGCVSCGHELADEDLVCRACDRLVVPAGAVEVPVDRPATTEQVSDERARRPRWTKAAAAVGLVAGLAMAVLALWPDSPPGESRARPAVDPVDSPVLQHFEWVRVDATTSLPESGASYLALRDETSLRWLDLDAGRRHRTQAVGSSAVPMEPIPNGVLASDPDEGTVRAVSPDGPLWSSPLTGDLVVWTDGAAHWQTGWQGSIVLTRHAGSSPIIDERIVLPRFSALVGFFDGRPITHLRGLIAIENERADTKVITRGLPIAQASDWLVYRPCVRWPCDEPAVRLNLVTGSETVTALGPNTTAHGGFGNQLSPDGDHLVTVSYGEPTRVAVTNLETGRALQVPRELLGSPGESAVFEWSPNGRLLAVTAADQLAVFDVQTGEAVATPFGFDGEVTSLAWVTSG